LAKRIILHTNGANFGAHYASQKNAENYHIAKQYEQEATFHQPRKRKLVICPHVFNSLFMDILEDLWREVHHRHYFSACFATSRCRCPSLSKSFLSMPSYSHKQDSAHAQAVV
jgi:hypothetical protein